MSDKLSDCQAAVEILKEQQQHIAADRFMCDPECELPQWDALQRVIDMLGVLAASPAPAIPAGLSDQQILDIAKRVTPAFRESPASCIALVREALNAAPAISESEDVLLTAARRAIPALAHAAERNPAYQRDYEELSKAIEDAARKGEKS